MMINAFNLALVTFWTYPVLAWTLFKVTKNKLTAQKILFLLVSSVAFITIIGLLTDISFVSKNLNYILFSLLYLTISLIIWWLCYRKKVWLKVIGWLFFIVVFGIGYFTSTAGILGLALILADHEPKNEIQLNEKISYKEIYWGNALSSSGGKKIEVYRTIPFLPFLEKKILEKEYNDKGVLAGYDFEVTLNKEKNEIYLSIPQDKQKNNVCCDTIYLNNY